MRLKNVVVALLLGAWLFTISAVAGAQENAKVELITAEHGQSGRLRDAVPQRPSDAGTVPLHHGGPPNGPVANDPVAQTKTTTSTTANSSSGLNFDGISASGYIPPDTNLSV